MESVLTKKQTRESVRYYTENGTKCRIKLEIRYDDECGNGHNSFAMTADIYEQSTNGRWAHRSGGCCHEAIAQHFPELAHLIKWHLCSSDGPMHYIANTAYHASDRDCHGRRKGDVSSWDYGVRFGGVPILHILNRQFFGFIKERLGTGDFQVFSIAHPPDNYDYTPHWSLVGFADKWHECPFRCEAEARQFCEALNACEAHLDKMPTAYSEGKERDFDAARSCGVWPDATNEELSSDDLADKLAERLPALLGAFKADVESIGFTF